jgi:hypothetical protein
MSGPLGTQDALVAVLAGVALAWLVSRRWRARARPGCEDCPGCAPHAARDRAAVGTGTSAPGHSGAGFVPLDAIERR